MAEISLSVAEVFEQAFGYKSSAFSRQPFNSYTNDIPSAGRTKKGSMLVLSDALGFEYYMPVSLGGTQLQHPVIQVTGRKNIVETALVERQGTVKELINVQDWEINIKGVIISSNDKFPEDDLESLTKLFYKKEAVEIESALTDIFLLRLERQGHTYAVIKELNFPEVRGVMNARPYEIKLVSDAPFDLTEIKD